MVFMKKWFWKYWYWTWPLIGVGLVILCWLVYALLASSVAWFVFFLLLSVTGIAIYRGVKGGTPPVWIMVVAICIPIFMWGFWVTRPEWYIEWRHSRYFLWMVLAAITLSWLANHKNNPVANTAKTGLLLLMVIAVSFGAYRIWQKEKSAAEAEAKKNRQAMIDAGDYPCPFNFEYLVTREWGPTVTRPAGCHFVIERRVGSVAYEMAATTTTGDVIESFPVGQDTRRTIPNLLSFRLRIMEGETENEVVVMVSLYRR